MTFGVERALFEDSRQHHSLQALQWEASYESGNRKIDLEHRELFRLANWLMDCIARNDCEDDVGQCLDTLLVELQRHFQNEESVLNSIGYSDTAEHGQEHARLLQKAGSQEFIGVYCPRCGENAHARNGSHVLCVFSRK